MARERVSEEPFSTEIVYSRERKAVFRGTRHCIYKIIAMVKSRPDLDQAAADFMDAYDHALNLDHFKAALDYYGSHPEEIDRAIDRDREITRLHTQTA